MSHGLARRERLRRGFVAAAALAGIGIGLASLLGWTCDIAPLKTFGAGPSTTKPNTAVAEILCGLSLLALNTETHRYRLWGIAAAALAALLAGATLLQYPTGLDFGIDQFLFRDSPGTIPPGRMASATAFGFLLVAGCDLACHARRWGWIAKWLGVAGLLTSLVMNLGHLYGAEELHNFGPFGTVALPTALALLALSFGSFAAGPRTGLLDLLLGEDVGGDMGRRLIPAALILPIALGYARLVGQRAGWYDTEFGLAIFAMSNVVGFCGLVYAAGLRVRRAGAEMTRIEKALRENETELHRANENLEKRVVERTAKLFVEEEKFRNAFEFAPIGLALVAPDGRWLRVNRAICDILGYSEEELLAIDFQTITHPGDLGADLDNVLRVLDGTLVSYQMEKRYFHKSGRVVVVLLSVSLVRDASGAPRFFVSQIQDIGSRKVAEERIAASLREKELLLKEIHHRVKNNLQIISSLLDLQSSCTADAAALELFRESRGRVRSMAMIHERLYRSPDLTRVNFRDYIGQLAEDLYRTYKISEGAIRLEVSVEIPPLAIDLAIPCGLLLNELISNCFKHAFGQTGSGRIRIELTRDPEGYTRLVVSDDGVGLAPHFDFPKAPSFGLQLVATLVEQLNGTVEIAPGPGAEFRIRFPSPPNPAGDRSTPR